MGIIIGILAFALFIFIYDYYELGHVKIRQHKAVCLKCDTCAKLSAARRKFKDHPNRSYIRQLHAAHRMTYMGERYTNSFRLHYPSCL